MLRCLILCLIVLSPVASSYANDSAAAIGVSGLQLKDEKRVVIEEEKLMIKADLVTVDYTFRNLSDEKVSTIVAFPIAPFSPAPSSNSHLENYDQNFSFKVWVGGEKITTAKQFRSFIGNDDITSLLSKARIPHDGNEIINDGQYDSSIIDQLLSIGAVRSGAFGDQFKNIYYAEWENHVTYYWEQEFPPNAIVKVRHEYKPVIGFQYVENTDNFEKEHKDSCINAEAKKAISESLLKVKKGDFLGFQAEWVNYILTTAKNWQLPIRDFELIIEKSNPKQIASICWEGKIEQLSDVRLRAHKKDFVPDKELKIYFYNLP